MEWNHLGNFIRGPYKEHLCDQGYYMNLGQQFRFKEFSILSSSGHFVQQSGTFWAILLEGLMMNIFL